MNTPMMHQPIEGYTAPRVPPDLWVRAMSRACMMQGISLDKYRELKKQTDN